LNFLPGTREDVAGVVVEQHEVDFLERGFALQMLRGLVQHDGCALFEGESGDSCSYCGKGDRFQATFGGDAQGVCDGVAEHGRCGASAELHARGVNDVACFQLSATGDRGVADRDASDRVALALDFFSAPAPDRSRDSSAKLKVIVRGVDDRIRVHVRQVALLDHNFFRDGFVHLLIRDVMRILVPWDFLIRKT
jgi:hypothetical protein